MREVKDRHIVVIGAAKSGIAAALFLHKKGAEVFVSDYGQISDEVKKKLDNAGIPFEENGHTDKATNGEFAVVSPGVPDKAPSVQHYMNAGKSVYSEMEVASWFNDSPMIAVTGSNGKTTVKECIAAVLRQGGPALATRGNFNNAIGVPLMLCELDPSTHGAAVFELGANHAGEIAYLASLVQPRVGVLTNAAAAHIEGFGSIEGVARAKGELFEALAADGIAVIPVADPARSLRARSRHGSRFLAGRESEKAAKRPSPTKKTGLV